jgi:hypothetical protein
MIPAAAAAAAAAAFVQSGRRDVDIAVLLVKNVLQIGVTTASESVGGPVAWLRRALL